MTIFKQLKIKLLNKKYLLISCMNCIFFVLNFQVECKAQNKQTPAIFLEIGGSGGLGSINIEKGIFQKNNIDITGRFGFSLAPIDNNNGMGFVFPILAHGLIGNQQHKAEFGLGQGLTVTTKGHFFLLTTPTLGYRYFSKKSGWFYRLSYTPLISYILDFQYQNWAGISIGYSFKNKGK